MPQLELHCAQVRDLYWTFRNFRNRVSDFLRYRRVTANMDQRFQVPSHPSLYRCVAPPDEARRGAATCCRILQAVLQDCAIMRAEIKMSWVSLLAASAFARINVQYAQSS